MQCSWKAVLLLALASIAIQYTAIRTFTAKSFHTCPGLAEAGLAERLCEESPTFAYNLSRKTHILILATTRSGSSFVGQLFNQHLDVFYLFEPLYHVQNTLIPRFTQGKSPADRRVMLGASRDLLRSLYDCDLYFLENYIKPPPVNHTTDRIFRRGASRVLCSRPVCDPPGPADLVLEEGGLRAQVRAAQPDGGGRGVPRAQPRGHQDGARARGERPARPGGRPAVKPQGHPAGPRPPRHSGFAQRDLPGHVPALAALVRHGEETLQPGRDAADHGVRGLLQLRVHRAHAAPVAQGQVHVGALRGPGPESHEEDRGDLRVPGHPAGQPRGPLDPEQHAGRPHPGQAQIRHRAKLCCHGREVALPPLLRHRGLCPERLPAGAGPAGLQDRRLGGGAEEPLVCGDAVCLSESRGRPWTSDD
uniref:Carbohydrate sulfotransferase 1 n=1 Tax=Macaca fascicularis TaxID=9541 RepID=A0A2K5V6T5_MACFA